MSDCPTKVDLIYDSENIGSSLNKIVNNFNTLKAAACDIEQLLDKQVEVRTFFYYGPNSATDSESGQDNGHASRPSNTTIESFVNDAGSLNLPSMSELGDIAYVIYQKTGWYSQTAVTSRSGSGVVPYSRTVTVPIQRKIGINWGKGYWVTDYVQRVQTFYAGYNWSANINDTYKYYAPVFVIYKLTFDGTSYTVNTNFPKFSRSATNSTADWNNPAAWSIY